MTLTPSARQLLALVRATLWQKPVDVDPFLSATADWKKIGKLAMDQTVGGLAFEAALTLPQNILPPKEWIHKAIAFIETNRRTHLHINKCAAEVVKRLREEGIEVTLLKGQAYASSYPKPEMRQCGDIDLYVGEDNYHAAYSAVKRFGWECKDEFNPDSKHYACELSGVDIELHRMTTKLLPRSVDRKYQQWSSDQIGKSERAVSIAGVEISLPSRLFDVVFVFVHLYFHFLGAGVGLRQICDWAIILHAHSREINTDELQRLLESFRLLKAWKRLAPILVIYLGLPEEECPLYSADYKKHATAVLSAIMEDGNFGRAKATRDISPAGYLARKIHSAKVTSCKYLRKFRFDPKRVSRMFSSYILDGTVRVIKDMKKGEGG